MCQSCLDIIWKVISKKEVKNGSYKNDTRISGFSSPRAFQQWSRNCRSPSGSLGNYFFLCVFLTLNPAVACCPSGGVPVAQVPAPHCGFHLADALFTLAAQIFFASRFLACHSVRVPCENASLDRRTPLQTRHINLSVKFPQSQPLRCLARESHLTCQCPAILLAVAGCRVLFRQ